MQRQFEINGKPIKVIRCPCESQSAIAGLFVKCGSRNEKGAKEAGISHLIEHMLFKGTRSRSAVDIIRTIEGCGGNFNACTSEEATCYYAHVPADYLGKAVEILLDMYQNAALSEEEFLKEKAVVIEEIKMYDDDPESVAMENLQAMLFDDSPLGKPVSGTEKSVGAMKTEDLRKYMKRNYTAKNAFLVLVGNLEDLEK